MAREKKTASMAENALQMRNNSVAKNITELRKAVQQELKRSATSTMDAILLTMLKKDFRAKDWNTERMQYVKRKHLVHQ